jgi:succinoglycan biosynthesis transport protein ExoP
MTTIPATISERVALPGGPAPGAGTAAALTPSDLLRILRGRLVLICFLFVFFSGLAVGGFFLWMVKFPSYSASALIECVSPKPQQPWTLGAEDIQKDEHERFLRSQALYVVQPDLLQDVLRTLEVQQTQWYASVDKDERLLELQDKLSCSPVRDSNYIQVAISTRSRSDPDKIVRKVVETYLQRTRERAVGQYRDQQAEYEREESEIRDRIQRQIEQIRDFAETLPAGAIPDQYGRLSPVEQELMTHQQQVIELELQTLELEGIQNIYDAPDGPGVTPEDRQMVELNPQVQMLQNQVYAIEQETQAKMAKFGENHREVKNLRVRLEEAQRQLDRTRDQKLRESIELKQEQVRTAFLNSQHALKLAQERLLETQAKQADIERKLSEYQRLQDELKFLKETQEKISDYVRDVKRVVAERAAVKIDVLQWPTEPLERSQPRWYFAVFGVMMALGLALSVAVLLELLDTSVRTPRDVVRYLNIPILGTIPDADDEEVEIERIEMAVREVPHSMVAEAFRAVRTALQFSAPVERMRTTVITSPRPEDGKTTVACNLASSLAISGRRVLLIDANFRRPKLHQLFSNLPSEGLSNILVGAGRLENLVTKTDLGNLDVLGSGPTPPNPAERLGSPLMRELLEEAASRYDQIIIDAPPVLLASDTPVLATKVDGAILVLRARENSRGVGQRAISMLNHVNAHLFGAVLNAAQVRRGGYFREQLRTFYDYQSEEALERKETGKALPGGTEDTQPKIEAPDQRSVLFEDDDQDEAENERDKP